MRPLSKDARRARPALGTLVEIRVSGAPHAAQAFEPAFQAIDRVHRLMSRQLPDSDVARLNLAAPGTCMAIDAWTWQVLRRAKEIHEATDGLFDCAAGPGRRGSLGDLHLLDSDRVVLRQRLALTLDGIAKGFAVDRAVEMLRAAGARAGSVNAGGDLRVFGEELQPIHVRHPSSPGRFIQIGEAREVGVASSGRYFANSTLFDPRTVRMTTSPWGVTVIAADCTTADALTKPCLLDRARADWLAAACGAQVVLVSPRYPLL